MAAFGRPAESQAHETSALRKHEAALAYLTQAGVQDSYALGKLVPDPARTSRSCSASEPLLPHAVRAPQHLLSTSHVAVLG
jgi:hypothetical protein